MHKQKYQVNTSFGIICANTIETINTILGDNVGGN